MQKDKSGLLLVTQTQVHVAPSYCSSSDVITVDSTWKLQPFIPSFVLLRASNCHHPPWKVSSHLLSPPPQALGVSGKIMTGNLLYASLVFLYRILSLSFSLSFTLPHLPVSREKRDSRRQLNGLICNCEREKRLVGRIVI